MHIPDTNHIVLKKNLVVKAPIIIQIPGYYQYPPQTRRKYGTTGFHFLSEKDRTEKIRNIVSELYRAKEFPKYHNEKYFSLHHLSIYIANMLRKTYYKVTAKHVMPILKSAKYEAAYRTGGGHAGTIVRAENFIDPVVPVDEESSTSVHC